MNQKILSHPLGPKTKAGRPLPTCLLGGIGLKSLLITYTVSGHGKVSVGVRKSVRDIQAGSVVGVYRLPARKVCGAGNHNVQVCIDYNVTAVDAGSVVMSEPATGLVDKIEAIRRVYVGPHYRLVYITNLIRQLPVGIVYAARIVHWPQNGRGLVRSRSHPNLSDRIGGTHAVLEGKGFP